MGAVRRVLFSSFHYYFAVFCGVLKVTCHDTSACLPTGFISDCGGSSMICHPDIIRTYSLSYNTAACVLLTTDVELKDE